MANEMKGLLRPDFPPHSYEDWKNAAIELLKGASFEKKLLTKTHEGITLQPIYRKEDVANLPHLDALPGLGTTVRSNRVAGFLEHAWEVSQELDISTAREFNQIAKEAIGRGQTELNLCLDRAGKLGIDPSVANAEDVGMGGISLHSVEDYRCAFDGIDLTKVSIFIKGRLSNFASLQLFISYLKEQGVDGTLIRGSIPLDPIGVLAKTGSLKLSLEESYKLLAEHFTLAKKEIPCVQSIMVCTNTYHNGGANAVQELAVAMATACEYIRKLGDQNVGTIDEIVERMRFSMGVGGQFFMELAKFRAFRLLWHKVASAFGASDAAIAKSFLFAKSAMWNKTVFDPYVNILRGTTEAFSAVAGGVNGLHIAPFDAPIRPSDEFSRRVSRNIQLILAEECEMTKVIDPAGGSWYIEVLTDELAKMAFDQFKEIEKVGGIAIALKEGTLQKQIEKVADEKIKSLTKRKEVLVGTNMYPNATEELLKPRPIDFAAIKKQRSLDLEKTTGETLGSLCLARFQSKDNASILPVRQRRMAEIFEELRLACIRFEEETSVAPTVFQANLGASRSYRARADWTSAFFQTSGMKVQSDRDFDTIEQAVEAVVLSNSKVVVLTSSDETYLEKAEEFARQLKAKNSSIYLLLAGAPGENESAWKAAGVDDFVNVTVNNYELNKSLLMTMGVLK